MIEPRWMGRTATKPGYGEPEPLKPAQTMDSPENVATCLNCRLGQCYMNSHACPLRGKIPAKRRRATWAELAARDKSVLALTTAGWSGADIQRELGITGAALKESMKRLKRKGGDQLDAKGM